MSEEVPEDNGEKLQQFCAITDCDPEVATHFLEACGGIMENAIALFYSNRADDDSADEVAHMHYAAQINDTDLNQSADHDAELGATANVNAEVRAPIPQTAGVLVNDPNFGFYGPVRKRKVTNSVFESFRDFQAESRDAQEALAGSSTAGSSGSTKRKTLEDLFKPPLDLTFKGTFEMAKEKASADKKWLLVNIQDVQEFACQTLNRDIFNNSAIRDLIENNFILWQVYNESSDGQRFQNYYQVTHYPHVAILDPRTGERLSIVSTYDAHAFSEAITTFLDMHPSFEVLDKKLSSAGFPACSSASSLSKSVHLNGSAKPKDVVTNSSHKSAKAVHDKVEFVYDDSDDSSSNMSADYDHNMPCVEQFLDKEDWPRNSSSNDASQKTQSSSASAATDSNTWKDFVGTEGEDIQLLFRFPDGEKERLVLRNSSFLNAILMFIASKGFDLTTHDVVLNYPRRCLTDLDPLLTLVDAKLGNQETIFVQQK